ncbi:hypothetical protein F5Y12DRAFT_783950 [Xylaria sp. FL1777]|nr:hypothetical protein F5Y12DRAFT_783950 [Xylaria sp. FL1777]
MFRAEGQAKIKIWLRRKVKCDEAYPACRRCVSTGRACDGYGVWGGGGGNLHGLSRTRDAVVAAIISPKPLHIPFLVASAVEKQHFDWFRHHTLAVLPGSFKGDFWDILLPQACLSERAVFNAVLALASVHRGGNTSLGQGKGNKEAVSMKPVNKVEIFTLEHYLQAITQLQPYFSCRNKASFRVTLIVCVVFVSIDFLRGNFNTAQNHIRGGLRLIADMQQLVSGDIGNGRVSNMNGAADTKACTGDFIDHSIMEILSRLYIQINLCQPLSNHSDITLFQIPPPQPRLHKFDSYRVAWLELDRLIHQIFHLTSQALQHQKDSAKSSPIPTTMTRLQRSILVDLERWSEVCKASKEALLGDGPVKFQKAYRIVTMCHSMATIMAHTCLHPEDESAFDAHTDCFLLLTEEATALLSIPGSGLEDTVRLSNGRAFDTARTIVDVGCLPQLYYVALKCRVHHVRHRAVELLQSMVHREGIWDARIAAAVARKVIEVEEGNYYESLEGTGEDSRESLLPALPECFRLRDVEAVYSGEPVNKVLLFCRGKQGTDDHRRVCIGQYEVGSQSWVDLA